jgi:leader peptidase (prepilin peptidase)/N-methyltransferase
LTPFEIYLAASVTLLGFIMGSAMTAIAYRVPRGLSWARGRSACTACGNTLGVRDLVPVLSWFASLGRCRHCGEPVPFRYPMIELTCGLWALLLILKVGPVWYYPLLLVWGGLLVALTFIDLEFQLLPDALTFPGTLIGMAAVLPLAGGPRWALSGVVIGAGLLWLLAELWIRVRRIEGMGGGDIKLAAMFGVVLGWKLTLLTLFLAALAGTAWGGMLMLRGRGTGQTALPFGSLLAPAAMISFLFGDRWVDWYVRLLRGA